MDLGQSFDNPSITLNPNLILIKKFSIVDEINPTQLPRVYGFYLFEEGHCYNNHFVM